MSFFSELKRRNIFKVAGAYLVIGWLLVESSGTVGPLWGLPDTIQSSVLNMVMLLFPIVLLGAWHFEATPEGIRRTKDVDRNTSITAETGKKLEHFIIGLLVVALVYFVWESRFEAHDTPIQSDNIVVAETARSIAVLPFLNLSSDPEQDYFSDGLSEEILNVLVRVGDLRVVGRTSSFQFKGQNQDLRAIGQALNVNYLLEGSVRKQGNRVRITAQLIQASDGFHLWSDTYDRDLSDIFAIQDELARAIADALAIELSTSGDDLVPITTSSMEAYDRYLAARELMVLRGEQNFKDAIEMLEQATELDPEFAAAWGALAGAHSLGIYYRVETREEGLSRGETAARRALALDPLASEAHAALASILRDKRQWLAAEDEYLLALEIDPQNVEANEQYAQFLGRTGRFTAALPYATKARQLNPLGPVYTSVEGWLRYALGEKEVGRDLLRRSNEMVVNIGGGNVSYGLSVLVLALMTELDDESLLLELRQHQDYLIQQSEDQMFAIDLDPEDGSDALVVTALHLERLMEKADLDPQSVDSSFELRILAALATRNGEYDLALDIWEIELELGLSGITNLDTAFSWFPIFSPIQSEPRMKAIREALGLPAYWRERGWPDNCRSVGERDYECDHG